MLTIKRKVVCRQQADTVNTSESWESHPSIDSALTGRLSEEPLKAQQTAKSHSQPNPFGISIARVHQVGQGEWCLPYNDRSISVTQPPNSSSSNTIQCRNHAKPATHRLVRDTPHYFCSKCAVALAGEGHRLERIDHELDMLKAKLQEHMNRQLDKAQQHCQRLLQLIQEQLKKLQSSIRQRYEEQMEVPYSLQEKQLQEVWLASFKPPLLNQSTLQKLRQYVGKAEWKPQPVQLLVEPALADTSQSRSSTSRSRLNSTRQRQPQLSNKKPTQIFIQLCEDEITRIDRKTFDAIQCRPQPQHSRI